jgi:hypothetical protein
MDSGRPRLKEAGASKKIELGKEELSCQELSSRGSEVIPVIS